MGTALFDFIIPFIVVLGVLVFIHELGHHLAAKLFGMKVDAFSLGFPPRAWGFRWGSRKLRMKFKSDIRTALNHDPRFQEIHGWFTTRGISRSADDTAALLVKAFAIRRETVQKEIVNKKGKSEKIDENVVMFSTTPAGIPHDLIPSLLDIMAKYRDLPELLADFADIEDDRVFHERFQTDYCLSWVPLGGYCKINGMIDESLDPDSMKEGAARPWEFRAKPVWQRIIVISGGVIFNFILAGLIFSSVALVRGIPELPENHKFGNKIGNVVPGSPAEKAGITVGDVIVGIDGRPISDWQGIIETISGLPDKSITIEWMRNGERMTVEVLTESTEEEGKVRGRIGVSPMIEESVYRSAGLTESFGYGFERMAYTTATIVYHLGQLVTGKQSVRESLGGPVMILRTTGTVKQQQGWEGIWYLMAVLSVSLAVFNLFPIPALDGGHLVFLTIEAVIRRPLSIKVRLYTQQVGMAILLTFIAYVIFNDIVRWTGVM
jgi:regulator of sigma E protease